MKGIPFVFFANHCISFLHSSKVCNILIMSAKNSESFHISSGNLKEKKMVNIAARIEGRNKSRAEDVELKKAAEDDVKIAEEKSSFFTVNFKKEQQAIADMLECDDLIGAPNALITEHFDTILISVQRLQKFFNDSMMFLPKFQSRKAQSQLTELNRIVAAKRADMLPKKKFAFKSKSKKNTNINENVENKNAVEKFALKAAQFTKQDCEVTNKSNESVILSGSDLSMKDVSVSKLDNCKVFLYGNPGTVHIIDVKNCLIVIGPVSGSVFVDRCENCTLTACCQQLRVHHTTCTDFYLHVTSRAIIEDTNSVRFAPYGVQYPDLQRNYQSSGLDQNENNWDKVNDFNWLALDVASPNWSMIPLEDRRSNWD